MQGKRVLMPPAIEAETGCGEQMGCGEQIGTGCLRAQATGAGPTREEEGVRVRNKLSQYSEVNTEISWKMLNIELTLQFSKFKF